MITRNSKLTFGKYRGRKLGSCDNGYLGWMVKNLSGDFFEWKKVAQNELEDRKREDAETARLGDAADQFLKDHDIDPNIYK